MSSKPFLRYVEFHAADNCNLNCRGCTHFSSLFRESSFPDLKQIYDDFCQLKILFSDIRTIRILGGEPLLNPELKEIICCIREMFPFSNISVVTNGLLLKKNSKEMPEVFGKNRIGLSVTRYPVSNNTVEEGIARFLDENIIMKISPVMEYFRVFLTTEQLQRDSFDSCMVKNCTYLRNGKLYVCAMSALIMQYNQTFGTNYPEEPGINIYAASDGSDVLNYLNRKTALCSYCKDNGRLKKWSCRSSPSADDWL